jgi:hypothetical protein
MKNLTVLIRAELEVPDDWELVEHPSGIQVLQVGDSFIDFDVAPLATKSSAPDADWSDADASVVDQVLETVIGLEVDLELNTRH